MIKALALLFPDVLKPFTLELGSTTDGISAILSQDSGSGRRAVAYGLRALTKVEWQFSLCEKEILVLVGALNKCGYLVGLTPITL